MFIEIVERIVMELFLIFDMVFGIFGILVVLFVVVFVLECLVMLECR